MWDFSWFTEIKIFDIPILSFVFNNHLRETITILLILAGIVSSVIAKLHNVFRSRRIPLSLKEKLYAAAEKYIYST